MVKGSRRKLIKGQRADKHSSGAYARAENIENLAIITESRKCLKCALLALYEDAGWPAGGLKGLIECYNDYMNAMAQDDRTAVAELGAELEGATGYSFGIQGIGGTDTDWYIMQSRAQSIKAMATALYKAAGWGSEDVIRFIEVVRDYARDFYSTDIYLRCARMLKETGLDKRIDWSIRLRR